MYKVKVNKTHNFNITQDDIDKLDSIETSPNQYHILKDHKTVQSRLIDSNFNEKHYQIEVNNNMYNVTISDELDMLIDQMGFATSASKQINKIEAPMPGLILELNVSVGDEVKENDSLLILEAMKMENVITSPRDGIIKDIQIKKGDTVDKNSLLIEFE